MTKRIFDIVVALAGLVILFPFLFLISLLIIADSPGGVLFTQVRVGKDRTLFRILKFRTMKENAERGIGLTVGGRDPRVTLIGYWLRRYKVDELPQLVNVLKGDMSLVGPRPEIEEYVAHYDKRQLQVLSVRPGITDPASNEFANENEYLAGHPNPGSVYVNEVLPLKLDLSLKYIRDRSFWSDVGIIFKTLIHSFR